MSSTSLTTSATTICGQPLARRIYKSAVVALAVFVATLAIVRVPFRGYLTEIQVAGPPLAGLDLEQAANWLKQVDSQVAAVAAAPNEFSPRSQIRITFVGHLPNPAMSHLNDLAARFLCQYLPDQLSTYRRAELADLRSASLSSREAEDTARQRLDELRQQQLARMLRMAAEPWAAAAEALRPNDTSATAPVSPEKNSTRERLESLRLELSRLLASYTDEHPQVITIRSQITRLENQLAESSDSETDDSGPDLTTSTGKPQRNRLRGPTESIERNFVAADAANVNPSEPSNSSANSPAGEVEGLEELNAAQMELTRASRRRQEAEQYLSERMQELSNGSTASDWAATRAHVVMRLGGTPRSATIGLAAIMAVIFGTLMFRAAAESLCKKIQTPAELATALEIPVIGNISKRGVGGLHPWKRWKPLGVQSVTHLAEGAICVAVVACLISVSVEPSLGQQVLADPFGALSEVVGRLTSG